MAETHSTNARALRVAAVQRPSQDGEIEANLKAAGRDVEEAARRGAQLVLLPELLAAGYAPTSAIWDGAEPKHGPTARFLAEQSRRHGVYLGASFLEADGEDFFNTFVLTTPSGAEAGRVRKQTPAVFEAFYMRGDVGPHVIATDLGRIGVGICYENHLGYTPRLFHEHGVDLVLMPHSAPSPPRRLVPPHFLHLYEDALRTVTAHYAALFGVPVVLANKSGPWKVSLPGLPPPAKPGRFPGLSAIADSDGRVRAALGAEAGLLVEDVLLDPARKRLGAPACAGRWSRPQPLAANLFRVIEATGRLFYAASKERRQRARAISALA
jgi:N-carbamoylputrescine amidase